MRQPSSSSSVRMAASPPSSSSLSSPSIILVDDEMDIVTMFCKVLQRGGYNVNGFSDPVHALSFFAANSQKVTVVITDLSMPLMSGIELAERIRELSPLVKIILVTAYDTSAYKDKIQQIGFVRVIRKPLTITNLRMIIDQVLDK